MNNNLISRQAAIDLAKDLMIPGMDYLQHNQAIMNYEAELVRLPSAEPEIIRCANCRLKHDRDCPIGGMKNEDDYCSRAVRRTNNDSD